MGSIVGIMVSRPMRTLLFAFVLHACSRAQVHATGELARAPVLPPSDSSWARLSRPCSRDAPIHLAPVRPPPPPGSAHLRDAHMADLSRQAPGGFGGLFIEHDEPPEPVAGARAHTRRVVVFLVDTTERDAALRALETRSHPDRFPLNVVGAQVRPARWSYAELYDWHGVLLEAGVREGVVSTGIDVRGNRIVFGVVDAPGRQRFENELTRFDLPCFLVGVEIVGRRVPG